MNLDVAIRAPKFWTSFAYIAIVATALLATRSIQARSHEKFSRTPTPTPTRVEPISFETGLTEESQASGGTFYLLGDYQVDLDPKARASYRHFAAKAVTDQGVDGLANIEIVYQPEFQTLQLHPLQIVREGKVLSQLKTADVRLLQRETELERAIIDGSKSAAEMASVLPPVAPAEDRPLP